MQDLFFSKIIILAIFLQIVHLNIEAQYINNGSFDYKKGFNGNSLISVCPDNWSDCNVPSNSPDLYKTYTFPKLNTILAPITNNTFTAIRARGVHIIKQYPFSDPRTSEFLEQKLLKPLSKYTCFKFSVYLCSDLNMTVEDSQEPNKSYPLALKVWGSSDSCTREKVLCVTEPVYNTVWKKFELYFSVLDTTYSYIILDLMWDIINVKKEPYNGYLFLDEVRIDSIGPIDTSNISTIYFKGIGKTTLSASNGDWYQWSQSSNLKTSNNQKALITTYSDRFSVFVGHKNSCPDFELFNIKIDCDSLYPVKLIDTFDVFYHPNKKIVLNADFGYNFSWLPNNGLSDYYIKSPYLTGHAENFYLVSITDEFNCVFQQRFNVLYNCDTIIIKKNFQVIDTILPKQASIKLIPTYGIVDGYWNPNKWLDCSDCQEPFANPLNTIIYSVKLKDEFNCIHQENFRIGVDLYVPNVITPNGDGYNDCFKIYGLPEGTIISIFSKSGRLVFTSSSYSESNCWEGKDMDGKQLETGTYWYSLSLPNSGLLKKGFVFLKR